MGWQAGGYDRSTSLPAPQGRALGRSVPEPDSAPLKGEPLTPEQVKHWVATADAWVDFMPEVSWKSHIRKLGLSEAHIEQLEQAMREEP